MSKLGFRQFISRDAAAILFWVTTGSILIATTLAVGAGGQWWLWGVAIAAVLMARLGLEALAIMFHMHDQLVGLKDELVAARQAHELHLKREEQAKQQAALAKARAAAASAASPPTTGAS